MTVLALQCRACDTLDQVDPARRQPPGSWSEPGLEVPTMGNLPEAKRIRKHPAKCRKCGGTDFYPSGPCKACALAYRETHRDKLNSAAKDREKRIQDEDPELFRKSCRDREKRYRQRHPDRIRESYENHRAKKTIRARELRASKRDQYNARARAYCARHPERRDASVRKWREKHPDAARRAALKRKYGLTLEQLNSIIESQDGKCAACRDPLPAGKHRHIDHDHTTMQVRGVLCARCNQAIGMLRDSPLRAERLAAYLRKHAPKLQLVAR